MPKFNFKSRCQRFLTLVLIALSSVINAQILTGSFTGDGTSSQAITGLGMEPNVVLVIPSTGGLASGEIQTWVASKSMPAGQAKYTNGGDAVAYTFKSDFISSMDSDGFTVASKSNVSGTTYYYIALSDDDGSVTEGTFTGNTAGQNVVLGYQPAMVWVWADGETSTDYMRWTMEGRPSGTWRFSHGAANWGENVFNGFSPVGFSVFGSSTGSAGIANGGTYYYVAFQGSISTANPGTSLGSATKVTTSVEPGFLMTRHNTINGNNTYIKTAEMAATESFIPRHEAAETDALLTFESDGYSVGSSAGQLRGSHYYFVSEKIVALPVELTKFSGKEVDGETILNWTTASEINNDYFEIQASNDGVNWETIKYVQGAGNSTVELNYSKNIGDDPNRFYRLKQVDFDGSFAYSNVIYVKKKGVSSAQLMVFPSPATNQVNVVADELQEGEYDLKVYAINGAIVKSTSSLNFQEGNMITLDVNDLAEGVYTVVVSDDYGYQTAQRFVKK